MALTGKKRKQQQVQEEAARVKQEQTQGEERQPEASTSNGTARGLAKTVNGTAENDEANDEWTTVEGGSKKKPKKEKLKAGKGVELATPLFQFDPSGFRNRNSVQIHDIRDLILNLLAKASHPKWLKISNKNAIRGVVCILAQGIEPSTLGLPQETQDNLPQSLQAGASTSKLPIFTKLFSHYCPTRAPGDQKKLHSVIQTLLNAPIPSNEKAKREAIRAKTASQAGGIDPAQYLLDPELFLEHGYIVPSYGFDVSSRLLGKGKKPAERRTTLPFEQWQRDDGLIETPQLEYPDDERPLLRILGIDCEMCVTTAGSEVCRISVIDSSGSVIYNTLVKPANKVIDYATIYSGITAELLEPVTTTLLDVQKKLCELIDYDTVLVGHSLNCDLVVLKLAHPWVIDTSVIYQHTRGPPFKASLKWLAQKWLQKEIQKPSKAGNIETIGHDSEEDARAAVELVKLKMERGPAFGEFANDQESIFERLGRNDPPRRTCIVDHGNPGQWHGAKADTAVSCKTDEEIVQGVVAHAQSHDFVFARLMDLSHTLGWSQPSNSVLGKTTAAVKNMAVSAEVATAVPTNGASDSSQSSEVYSRLEASLAAIHASLPLNTAFIILSGHNDPRTVLSLSAKKNRFDVLYKTGTLISQMKPEDVWSNDDDRALTTAVAKVREGMTFLAIKR